MVRLVDLPVPHDLEMDGDAAVREGRGRASSRDGRKSRELVVDQEEEEATERRIFRTPASWTSQREPLGEGPVMGPRTSGLMPTEEVTLDQEGKSTEGPFQGRRLVQDQLERDLEKEVVKSLHQENLRLKQRLQEMEEQQRVSGSGWSEVTADTPGPPPPPPSMVRGQEEGWEMVRWTPNGTRVPDGPPPRSQEVAALLPEWPFEWYERTECDVAMKWLGQPSPPVREKLRQGDCEGGMESRVGHGEYGGGVNPRLFRGEGERGMESRKSGAEGAAPMTAVEARTAWLERELMAMKRVMEREASLQQRLRTDYWRQPVQYENRPQGRVHGGHPEGVRAEMHGGYLEGGRAELHGGHREGVRAEVHGEHREGVRAEVHGGHREEVRAGLHGGHREGVRASEHGEGCERSRADEHGAHRDGDRAVGHGGECEGSRGALSAGAQGHGEASQSTNPRSWNEARTSVKDEKSENCGGRKKEEEDTMKATTIVLPTLNTPVAGDAGLTCGDWLAQLRPLMGDLATTSLTWWDDMMAEVMKKYKVWLAATPLERLAMDGPIEEEYNTSVGRKRMDLRASSLLLGSWPSTLKGELIASRELSSGRILYKVLKTFQPGGASERATTLSALTLEKQAKDPRDAAEQLRKWQRHKLRAEELRVLLPDPSLMVRSLSRLVEGILISSPQANFRVNAYRMQSRIDIHPTMDSLNEFFTLLLAEMESLMLSPETGDGGERPSKTTPNVKAMQGDGRDKGEQGGKGEKGGKLLCRSWGTPEGCRFGKACRFEHPVLADSRDRCWTCSATTHQKSACPYNKTGSPQKPMGASGGSDGRDGRGKASGYKGQGKGPKGGETREDKGKGGSLEEDQEKRAAALTAAPKDEAGMEASGKGKGDEKPSGEPQGSTGETTNEAALLTEVTSLLRSLRGTGGPRSNNPAVKVAYVRKLDPHENTSYLLDGGATNPLRQCRSQAEWDSATPTVVNLALGEASLRQKDNGTLLTKGRIQPIIPVQDLTMIGVKVVWQEGMCHMELQGTKLGVYMDQGCPCVGATEGRRLMEQVEEMHSRKLALKSVKTRPRTENVTEDEKSMRFFYDLFPQVPQHIAEKVVGFHNFDASRIPWNRRMRKKVEEATTLVVHLYCGKNKEKWRALEKEVMRDAEPGDSQGLVILCVDIEHGGDLHNPHIMGYLENLARRGKISMIVGGPPCRTVSAARLRDDDGPRAVRGRGSENRWGLPRNTIQEQLQCDGDSALWLKMLWITVLGRYGNPDMETMIEQRS